MNVDRITVIVKRGVLLGLKISVCSSLKFLAAFSLSLLVQKTKQ